jgi:hypothetical protein
MSEKTVFITYSDDTPEHSQRVLQLANALRGQGVDAELDQYHIRIISARRLAGLAGARSSFVRRRLPLCS